MFPQVRMFHVYSYIACCAPCMNSLRKLKIPLSKLFWLSGEAIETICKSNCDVFECFRHELLLDPPLFTAPR
jgi:hypothetical protein